MRDYSSVLLYIDTVLTTYACNLIVFLAVKSRFFDNDIERPLSPEWLLLVIVLLAYISLHDCAMKSKKQK